MSEWKNYGETNAAFDDYGSVGETQPVDAPSFGGNGMFPAGAGSTVPVGGNPNFPVAETIPEPVVDPFPPSNSGWDDASKTISVDDVVIESGAKERKKIAGWLVCIDGADKGVDFHLTYGYTYIGRGVVNGDNKKEVGVKLSDKSLTRSSAIARVLYEDKKHEFYVSECSGAEKPTYLNGELVSGFNKLAAGDVIEVGNSKLLFVPLCTEKFSWEE